MNAININVLNTYLAEMKYSINGCDGQFYEVASKICNACFGKENLSLFPINFLLSYTKDITTIVDMFKNDNSIIVFLYSNAKGAYFVEIYDMEIIDLYRFCKYLINKCKKL